MAIERTKQLNVPGPSVQYVSPAAQQLNNLLGGLTQIASGLAEDKRKRTDEAASIERQGFDAELQQGFAQFDTEDGFDLNGFTQWTAQRSAAKTGPMNQAVFRGNAQSLAMKRISQLKSKDAERTARMDRTIVAGKTTGVEPMLRENFRLRLLDDRKNNIETSIHGAAQEYADSIGAETEDGKAEAYEQATAIFSQVQAGLFADERAEKQGLAVRGFTEQSTEMFLAGAPLDAIDAVRKDAVRVLAEDFGFDRGKIASLQQDWLAAMASSAVKRGNLDALDRVEAVNKRMYDASAGREVRDGFAPATWAEMKRLAENEITSGFKGKLADDLQVWLADARTIEQVKGAEQRVLHSLLSADSRLSKSVRAEDETAMRLLMENRQGEIIASQQADLLGPIEDAIKQPESVAAMVRGADRLNELAANPPTITLLNGQTTPLIDKATHRLMADKLEHVRTTFEQSKAASLTVRARISTGRSLADLDPSGPEAKEVVKIVQQRIEDGSSLPREIVGIARLGMVPDELVSQFGRTMFPEGVGPDVVDTFDENFSAFTALQGMNSPVARKIEQQTPSVSYLVELERLGVPRQDIARRVQEYGREKIDAALELVEDGIAKAGSIKAHPDTPYARMVRAQAMDNVLRTLDPVAGTRIQKAQRELGKAEGAYKLDEISGLVDKAIESAKKQVQGQVRDLPIYGSTITLPRNGWSPEGQPRTGMFDKIDPSNLDAQIEALVQGEGLNLTEPSMYRGGVHRRVRIAADSLESLYNPETGRTSWRMRVDYVPATTTGFPGFRTTTEEYAQARTLGWISLMQDR